MSGTRTAPIHSNRLETTFIADNHGRIIRLRTTKSPSEDAQPSTLYPDKPASSFPLQDSVPGTPSPMMVTVDEMEIIDTGKGRRGGFPWTSHSTPEPIPGLPTPPPTNSRTEKQRQQPQRGAKKTHPIILDFSDDDEDRRSSDTIFELDADDEEMMVDDEENFIEEEEEEVEENIETKGSSRKKGKAPIRVNSSIATIPTTRSTASSSSVKGRKGQTGRRRSQVFRPSHQRDSNVAGIKTGGFTGAERIALFHARMRGHSWNQIGQDLNRLPRSLQDHWPKLCRDIDAACMRTG